jgi:hypothetical protein
MGHRTLVAYDRDGYDLHEAHWGADPERITPETPFGGPPDDDWAQAAATDLIDPGRIEGGELTERRRTAVDSDPIATGLSFGDVCARIDPLEHEALYVVSGDFSVRTYLVFALRRPDAEGCRTSAALVGYDGESDATYLRGWLAGARAARDTDGTVVGALRWLDPERGTVVYLDDERGV